LRRGKFLYPLPAGAAGRNQLLAAAQNQNFGNFTAAAGNHGGNGAGFGTAAAGI